jgi:ATP-dependent DNA helicase RecQ
LKILQRAGYIEYTEEQDNQARVMFTVSRNDLYRLENNSPNEDKIITALLRSYGGLFTDYNYIDEAYLASITQLQPQQVYLTLKSLSQRHILHFIPQKKTPFIRYTQRREDKEYVQLMPEVYEERKSQFAERINSMILYATCDNICRSRQLLRYFGEKNDHNCKQCDVCLSQRKEGMVSEPKLNEAATKILQLLDDGKPHPITELKSIELPDSELDAALDYLSNEEYILQKDGLISKS